MKNKFFASLKNKRTRWEFFKSVLVGWTSTGIDFLVTAIVLYIEGHEYYSNFWGVFTNHTISGIPHDPPTSIYMTATMLGFTISLFFNYILSMFFVYEYGNVGKNKKGFIKFAIFALIGLAITTVSSLVGYAVLHGNVWWVKVITTCIVFVFNFFTRKHFVFNINLIRDDENTINL